MIKTETGTKNRLGQNCHPKEKWQSKLEVAGGLAYALGPKQNEKQKFPMKRR